MSEMLHRFSFIIERGFFFTQDSGAKVRQKWQCNSSLTKCREPVMFSAGGNYMWSITEILFWFFSLFKGEKEKSCRCCLNTDITVSE